MEKPKKKTVSHYHYSECAQYVAHKLGYPTDPIGMILRDLNGVFKGNSNAEYLDFWHCIIKNQEVNNPCYIYINSDFQWPDWALDIVKCFEDEFGKDTEYWIEW